MKLHQVMGSGHHRYLRPQPAVTDNVGMGTARGKDAELRPRPCGIDPVTTWLREGGGFNTLVHQRHAGGTGCSRHLRSVHRATYLESGENTEAALGVAVFGRTEQCSVSGAEFPCQPVPVVATFSVLINPTQDGIRMRVKRALESTAVAGAWGGRSGTGWAGMGGGRDAGQGRGRTSYRDGVLAAARYYGQDERTWWIGWAGVSAFGAYPARADWSGRSVQFWCSAASNK